MTDRVNGGVLGGEFLTGKMDFFSLSTSLLMDQTNVNTPVWDLYQISANVWTPVTIVDGHGVSNTYATKADYVAAWKKQQNLNKVINVFGLRANPVIVSCVVGEGTVVNLATEKTGLWYVDDGQGNYYPPGFTDVPAADSNYSGYKLETELGQIKVWAAGDAAAEPTDAPSASVTFGLGGNSSVVRRIVL